MSLEVNTFTLAGNDIEVVDQYARDQIQEIITTEVTKQYVDNADAALQAQIDTKTSKTYVDDADAGLQNQINALPSKTYVDNADAGLQNQINALPSKTYVDNADADLQNQINEKQATITGAATTVTSTDLTAARALYSNAEGKIAASTVTSTELGRLSGVTSAIQTQINGKQDTITGAATTVTSNNLTGSRALGTNGDGKIAVSSVTTTELDCLQGVTSAIQTQINGKQDTITGAATTVVSSNLSTAKALYSNSSGKIAASTVTSTELGRLSGVTSNIQTQLDDKFDTSNFTNAQYEEISCDQIALFFINISTLKILYLRNAPKINISSGWTQLTDNGSNILIPTKYRPITDQYLTEFLPIGQRCTMRINADGTIHMNLQSAADSQTLFRINYIYI